MPVCARCPKNLGHSCCEPGVEDKLATITHADVARIAADQELAPSAFVEEDVLDPYVAMAYETHRPLYEGYFTQSPVRLTLARREGACVFHERERGCSLSSTVRPVSCRLYPFEPWPDGSLSLLVERHGDVDAAARAGGGCLAVEESQSMDELLRAFGMTQESVAALGQLLRAEVKAHGRTQVPPVSPSNRPRRRLRSRS